MRVTDQGEFGVLLRDLRRRAGLTQEELAERAGLSPTAVSALERGVRNRPYPHTRAALARALGLDGADRAALEARPPRARHPTRLPAPTDELVGRQAQLAAVVDLLASTRVVTLTGPGGVGKTRLALAAAGRAAPRHRDGVAFVALAGLRESREVLPAVATAVGVADLGPRDLLDVLVRRLRLRRLLLVLDNAEHVLGAAPALSTLVAAAPGLTLLTTSRAPLGLSGEHVHRVPPMPTDEAVELFRRRVLQAGGTGTDPHADVATLCARLDHLPLAIEIAAARGAVLPAARIVEHLDAVLLTEPVTRRDAPERQRTVAATVRWSLDLLPEHVQRVLVRLTAFVGPWTLEAASAVAEVGPTDIVDAHSTLVAHSLLIRVDDEPRFAMLATVRDVLLETSDHRDGVDAAADRHATWYRDRLLAAGPQLWGPHQAETLAALAADDIDIRAAAGRLLAQNRSDELAAGCTSGMLMWLVRGQLSELERFATAGLAVTTTSALTRGRWHCLAGWAVLPRGRFAEADEHFTEAVELTMGAAAPTEAAWARVGAAYAAAYGGDLARARALVDQGRHESEADVHLHLSHLVADAHVRIATGDLTGASALLSAALPRAEQDGSPWTLAVLLGVLGRLRGVQGEPDEAHTLLVRSIRISGTLGDTWGAAHQLTHLADAAALRDEPQRAALLYGAVDGLADEVGTGVFPVWRDLSHRCQARAVEALGMETFASLRRRGRELRTEKVLGLATGNPVVDFLAELVGDAEEPPSREYAPGA